ncbi:hypothetical protein MMC30_008285 [Trapelia coarctata]|nr:hypothetical protein [Trapelia coarctata]
MASITNEGIRSFNVRRVRLVRPIFTYSRVWTITFYAISISAFNYLLSSIEDEEEEAQNAAQAKAVVARDSTQELEDPERGEEEDEDEENIVPTNCQKIHGSFRWVGHIRELRRFTKEATQNGRASSNSRRIERRTRIYGVGELAGLVGKFISNMRQFQKFLGTPIETRKYWLNVDFPDGPPPEYERAGLEITDDYVAWTVRPVSPMNLSRL